MSLDSQNYVSFMSLVLRLAQYMKGNCVVYLTTSARISWAKSAMTNLMLLQTILLKELIQKCYSGISIRRRPSNVINWNWGQNNPFTRLDFMEEK